MKAMFRECNELKELNLFYFNTSNVEDMSYMFYNCYNLKEIKGINNFKTIEFTDISYMFDGCKELDLLHLFDFPNGEGLEFKSNEKISKDLDMSKEINLEKQKHFVIFISRNYNINFSIFYEEFDIFSKLEEEFYLKYPNLNDKKFAFFANGEEINRTSTMIENNIKNGNFIFIKHIK